MILPGVGAFGVLWIRCAASICYGLRTSRHRPKPLVGVCLGGAVADDGELSEFGQHRGLGIIEGRWRASMALKEGGHPNSRCRGHWLELDIRQRAMEGTPLDGVDRCESTCTSFIPTMFSRRIPVWLCPPPAMATSTLLQCAEGKRICLSVPSGAQQRAGASIYRNLAALIQCAPSRGNNGMTIERNWGPSMALPANVIFVQALRDVNQRPASIPEFRHTPERRDAKYLHMDEEGVCDACREHKQEIDWQKREDGCSACTGQVPPQRWLCKTYKLLLRLSQEIKYKSLSRFSPMPEIFVKKSTSCCMVEGIRLGSSTG